MDAVHLASAKKKADRLRATLIFLDESGFLLTPNVTRTWARRGKTPYLHHWFKHDRIAVIGALMVSPARRQIRLSTRFFRRTITGLDIRRYLNHLLRDVPGPVVLVWDRGMIHRREEVRRWLGEHPRLMTYFFPAYAPELNPAEHIWTQVDQALYNLAPATLTELLRHLRREIGRLSRSPHLLWSCLYASELPWKR